MKPAHHVVSSVLACLCAGAIPGTLAAQSYPSKTITIEVKVTSLNIETETLAA